MSTATAIDLEAILTLGDEDDIWHIGLYDDDEVALCGEPFKSEISIPIEEVPTAQCCKACDQIATAMGIL